MERVRVVFFNSACMAKFAILIPLGTGVMKAELRIDTDTFLWAVIGNILFLSLLVMPLYHANDA